MPESTVACPHCQQSIRVMTEHAGNQVACPFCQNAMVVPEFETTVVEPTRDVVAVDDAMETVGLLTFACSHCVQPFQVESDSLGQAVRCPACGLAVQLPERQAMDPVQPDPSSEAPAIPKEKTRRRKPKPRPRAKPRPRSRPGEKQQPVAEPKQQPVAKEEPAIVPAADAELPSGKPARPNAPVLLSPGRAVSTKRNGDLLVNGNGADLLPPRFEPLLPRMDDIALSADGKAVASMSFQEPVKSILVNGHERVLRRLSPEEKLVRRRQRNAVLFFVGMLVLGVTVAILVRR